MLPTVFENSSANPWADVLGLLPVVMIDTCILLVLGQPFIAFGAIALAAGIATAVVRNRPDAGASGEPPEPPQSVGWRDVRIPVMLLLTEEQLAKIDRIVRTDSTLRNRSLVAGRQRFIVRAVDEKLARTGPSERPLAA
jgi:hypothetical protein